MLQPDFLNGTNLKHNNCDVPLYRDKGCLDITTFLLNMAGTVGKVPTKEESGEIISASLPL